MLKKESEMKEFVSGKYRGLEHDLYILREADTKTLCLWHVAIIISGSLRYADIDYLKEKNEFRITEFIKKEQK